MNSRGVQRVEMRIKRGSRDRILLNRGELASARAKLAQIWRKSCVDLGTRIVGVPSGRFEAKLYWNEPHRLWASFPPLRGERKYWNAFGLDDPRSVETLEIVAEVNTPVKGVSKKLQGVFIREGKRGITLLHRGRFNVGNRGFTKEQFLEAYRGETIEFAGDQFLLVARLNEPDVVGQCVRWLRAVARMKESLRPARVATQGRAGRETARVPTPPDPERERHLSHLLFRS